ncbi:uncharacterized protein LOC125316249 [Rhodamnia argentea]|uniref:Uncharacterized protein LOC125316249 n=1 Tax=Rhodamnia argentea TaxID=178133 RepID=A0ABM3HU45_9MYRT|nr:uncharacterized protein LOC125316249 [Rhodamnia argentea]
MECSCGKMIEQAKEELQALETQHPCRFADLKVELKSFILLLESQHFLLHHHHISSPLSSSFSVSTQESTCRKRKKRGVQEMVGIRAGPSPKQGRIDAVLDRAKSCLQKIQDLKTSFC